MPEFFVDNYNVIIVLCATLALGISTGLVGFFLVLKKESLVSDAITHATLPGLCLGFFLALHLGLENGRSLPLLLGGSMFTGYLGAKMVQIISTKTILTKDTAIAVTMSTFYGAGMMLFSMIQNTEGGNKAGLGAFLLGQVSGITHPELIQLSILSAIIVMVTLLNYKALRLLCFDPLYANLCGLNLKRTEKTLLALTILVVCVGLKTVGLILIIALLIIPPITARLVTNQNILMAFLSCIIGAISCVAGVLISANYDLPTGATIILCCFGILCGLMALKSVRGAYE